MSRRTADASKAIRLAWEKEQQRVLEGEGTRDWTKNSSRILSTEVKPTTKTVKPLKDSI